MLNLIAGDFYFQAEARLAAKRAARAEAREIRLKEIEKQQKEVWLALLQVLLKNLLKIYNFEVKSDSVQSDSVKMGELFMSSSELPLHRAANIK